MKKRTLNEYRQTKEYYTHKETKKKDQFVEDLIQSRIEQAIDIVTEDTRDELYHYIHEAMLECDLINFDNHGDITQEMNDSFHTIYIGVLFKLITEQLK
jgi:hypothetical protein